MSLVVSRQFQLSLMHVSMPSFRLLIEALLLSFAQMHIMLALLQFQLVIVPAQLLFPLVKLSILFSQFEF